MGIITLNLEKLRASKLAEIANARWEAETSPFYFEAKGYSFDTSALSQIKVNNCIESAMTLNWKTVEGAWVQMTPADFSALKLAYQIYVAGLFVKEEALKTLVANAETPEAVQRINWETEV
jgi:predicted small secreted protein